MISQLATLLLQAPRMTRSAWSWSGGTGIGPGTPKEDQGASSWADEASTVGSNRESRAKSTSSTDQDDQTASPIKESSSISDVGAIVVAVVSAVAIVSMVVIIMKASLKRGKVKHDPEDDSLTGVEIGAPAERNPAMGA